ncbi:MAG: methylmalonyl-CoA mutase, partial [Candidatus Binatia bacterium]
SILSGAHNYVFPEVIRLLKEKGMGDVLVFGGGIVPQEDIDALKREGVAEIFTPGTPLGEIIEWVRAHVKPKPESV